MKTLLLLTIATLASCALPPLPDHGPNPLDRPDDGRTIEEIRQEHMRAITGNPGWR